MPVQEDEQILEVRPESLVQKVTWHHYMFYVIHAFQSIATAISTPVLSQYLYSRLNQEYFGEHNITYIKNTTSCRSLGHCYINKTTEEYHIQQKVQAVTAGWTKTFSYTSGIPEILIVLIIGSWMDILGRKIIISMNMIGHIIRYITYALLMKFTLPTEFLLLGYVAEGLTGGYRLNMLISFAYTADITPKNHKRALLIVASEHIFAACGGFASVGAGYFICHAGYFWPLILAIAILILMLILFVTIVPETVTKRNFSELSPKMTFKRLVKFYICSEEKPERNEHKFWLCLLAFATLSLSVIGEFSIETLFVLNSPFCWDSVKIGNFSAVMSFLSPIFTLTIFKLMQRCMTPELIGSTTFLFFIARCFIKAFAVNDFMIYVSGIIGSPGLLSFAMIRTIVSHLTDPSEQGSVFAGLGTVEALCGMTSSVMLNTIYAHTLFWMKGFVFIVVAISCLIPASLLLTLHFVNKKEKKKKNIEISLDTNTTTDSSNINTEEQATVTPAVNAAYDPDVKL